MGNPADPDDEGGSGPRFARHVDAIRRFKWIALVVLLAGTGAGIVAAKRVRPIYEVRATIWISATTPPRAQTGPIRAEELLAQTSWLELFRAFAIVDSVVMKRRLYVQPANGTDRTVFGQLAVDSRITTGDYVIDVTRERPTYRLRTATGTVLDSGAVTDSVGRRIGLRWQPGPAVLKPGRSIAFRLISPRDASLRLLDDLQASMQPNSNFMRLSLRAPDAVDAAATLNLWVSEFVATAADLKRRNITEFAKILESQLAYGGQRLREAEIALETFRVNTVTLPSESGQLIPGLEAVKGPVFADFFSKRVEQDNLRRDREGLERAMAIIERGEPSAEALAAQPTVLQLPGAETLALTLKEVYAKEAELRNAQRIYTDEHATVKRLRDEVAALRRQTLPQLASALLARLREQERALDTRVAAQASDLRGIPARTIEEMRLRRQVSVAENLYASLQSRYEEAKLAEASAVPDVAALDMAAPPTTPLESQRQVVLALAFGLSLAAGLGLPVLLGQADQRFRYIDQVTTDLRLPILGSIPVIGRNRPRGVSADFELVEACRCLRLHLQHAFAPGETLILSISSAAAGDGKSLVASNLAMALANAGYRTLLIDGDTRRGGLHDVFGVVRRPGLSDVLLSGQRAAEALRATSHPRMMLLPSGSRSQRNPEIIAGPRLPALITELRTHFDAIIVDTPPLSAGVDALALTAACGSLAFVVRHGHTHLGLAKAMLELVDRLPVRHLGAVLNAVEARGAFAYYSYDSSYATSANGEEPGALPVPDGPQRVPASV